MKNRAVAADNKEDIIKCRFMVNDWILQKYTKNLSCPQGVEIFVEKNVRLWKKMENYTYLCDD